MSVRTEIDRIITAVTKAHEKVLAKGGTTAEPYLVANLEGAIDTIPEGGTTLPTLTNPGSAEHLMEGYELIEGEGKVVTGTHVCSGGETASCVFGVSNHSNGPLQVIFSDINGTMQIGDISDSGVYDGEAVQGEYLYLLISSFMRNVIDIDYSGCKGTGAVLSGMFSTEVHRILLTSDSAVITITESGGSLEL